MANEYNTELVCKSNSQLLQEIDPNEIIKKRNSKFISCKDGVYYFHTRSGTMHGSIVALSKKYPNEVFIARYRDDDNCFDSEIDTYKYKSGWSKCIKTVPDYWYDSFSHIEKIIGKESLKRFMEVLWKKIKKIDSKNDILTTKKNGLERKYKINSSITINVEDKDFKIEATKIGSSCIKINGFIKDAASPRWQLIEREKNLIAGKDQQDEKSDDEAKEEE